MELYIIHYNKLHDRKKYLDLELSKYNFDVTYIDEFDRDNIDLNNLSIKYNKNLWIERTSNLYSFNVDYRELNIGEICNSLSHLKALTKISESNSEYAVILEDDAILQNDFENKITHLLSSVPMDFDFIFFGSSYDIDKLDIATLSKSIKVNSNIYIKEPGTSRTVDGYIVSKKCSEKILNEILEISLPFDFELNYFFRKLNTIVYWYEPGLIYQGSQSGNYSSSIR